MVYLLSDVEEWEKEYPDDINKVPIEPNEFDTMQVLVLFRTSGNDNHNDCASDNVKPMEPRRRVIERPKRVCCDRIAVRDLC